MKAVVQVVILALALVLANSACAMSCSKQPCHGTPPCHQQKGQQSCDHALPVVDLTAAVHHAPVFIVQPIASQLSALRDQSATRIVPRTLGPPPTDVSAPAPLRI